MADFVLLPARLNFPSIAEIVELDLGRISRLLASITRTSFSVFFLIFHVTVTACKVCGEKSLQVGTSPCMSSNLGL